ncbi:MAG: hypothetical protein LBT54_00830, partial [Bifidobacteriaceae bacterium]|nr:hypothetical protein [Bifidobacteriaceae bacterium]
MKPLDPRLLRHARSTRGYIVLTAGFGVLTAALVVGQAILIASVLGEAAQHLTTLRDAVPRLIAIVGIALARAVVSGAQERLSHRSATRVIAELRGQLLTHAVALGPRWLSEDRSAKIAALTTRGLDALDAYFSRYLPQLLMVATLTPGLLIVVGVMDWLSAVIILITLPLIPVFMVLIGKLTAAYSRDRIDAMTALGARVLDLLSGLPTLKALGREQGPAARVRELSDAHARATFGTVRIAFLSGAALELISTLSVALVAVEIGLRLVYAQMGLTTGLAVLIMAPEVYFPLRAVGTHFHASANGVAAAEEAFEVLETPARAPGTVPAPDLATAVIRAEHLTVHPPGRDRLAPHDLSFELKPGTLTALAGPNGSGKSTAV